MASIKPAVYFTHSHHAVNAVKVTVLFGGWAKALPECFLFKKGRDLSFCCY